MQCPGQGYNPDLFNPETSTLIISQKGHYVSHTIERRHLFENLNKLVKFIKKYKGGRGD